MDVDAKSEEATPFSQATVRLSKQHLGAIDKVQMKIGSKVRLVLYGSLRSIEKSQVDTSTEGADVGNLEIEVSKLSFASSSDIAELFSDEIDG